jgi:hypothetical protein
VCGFGPGFGRARRDESGIWDRWATQGRCPHYSSGTAFTSAGTLVGRMRRSEWPVVPRPLPLNTVVWSGSKRQIQACLGCVSPLFALADYAAALIPPPGRGDRRGCHAASVRGASQVEQRFSRSLCPSRRQLQARAACCSSVAMAGSRSTRTSAAASSGSCSMRAASVRRRATRAVRPVATVASVSVRARACRASSRVRGRSPDRVA